MASVLQQQLAAIAANSTHQLDLKAQKARHSKSLLFNPRDAASQNFDIIFQLCHEGFDELCKLDARFAPFSRNLFSEQSKDEDRTQMTAKENEELDRVIETFLGLVGSRLLLKPAMKATEWLVRRFRSHEYNTEAMLLTFLPYHASHIFPTLLSILPERLPSSFQFLQPYVASLQPPPRHAVIAAASSSSAFFTTFSQYVLNIARATHHSAILLGFWASIVAQAVNGMVDVSRSGRAVNRRQREEDILLKVLPVLQGALAIRRVSELYLGSCMIMTILATKASLSEKVLDALMEAVAGGWTEQTVEDGVMCLAVLCQEKEQVTLPRSVSHALVEHAGAVDMIGRVGLKVRTDRLLSGVSIGAVHSIQHGPNGRASELVLGLLKTKHLLDTRKVDVLRSILKFASKAEDENARIRLIGILSEYVHTEGGLHLMSLAAQDLQLSISQLDENLALQVKEAGNTVGIGSEDDTPMDLDHHLPETTKQLSIRFDSLPRLRSGEVSFLSPKNNEPFGEYCAAFQQALYSEQEMSVLLNLPAFERKACAKTPGLFSFLARVWTSEAPNFARLKALQITCGLLQRATSEGTAVDLQGLMLYFICALADSSKTIRSAAASGCLNLSSLHNGISEKSPNSDALVIWGKSTIYGEQSSKVQWLAFADARKFLTETVLPTLEDCVLDSSHISKSLANVINASSSLHISERRGLKSTLRANLYAFMVSHIAASPAVTFQLHLLAIANNIGKIAGSARTHILLPYVREYILTEKPCEPVVIRLTEALVGSVTHRSTEETRFLKSLFSGELVSEPVQISLGFQRLQQIWPAMKGLSQVDMIDSMMDLKLNENTPEDVQTGAMDALRNLVLSTEVLVHLIESLRMASDLQGTQTPAKKRRTSKASEVPVLGNLDKGELRAAVRRFTLVLELIEESTPENHPGLLKGLFHLLSELHHYKTLLDSELVYLQGLIINSLLSVVNGLKTARHEDVDRSVIRADLIVDCVRTTSNTQVHHSALLLMSALASWAPDLVLHSVMPLFTFMSSTILKQGDEYSAHVTDQTVSQIIPPLAASLKKRGKDLISGAAELLLSFTAAFEHIPIHRRSGLFQHLVKTLGADDSLFAIVSMLIERYSDDTSVRPFISHLMDNFPVSVQLHAVQQYLDLVFDTRKQRRNLSDVILAFGEKNAQQASRATSALLEGLADILTRNELSERLAKELRRDRDGAGPLCVAYSAILEKTLQLGIHIKDDPDLGDSASNVLTAVLGLMPTRDFIESSAMLMQTGSNEIREQVFLSLEQRVNSAKRGDAAMKQVFIDVLPNCLYFVTEAQPLELRLAALTCVDRISDKFGKTDPTAVLKAAEHVAGHAALGSEDLSLRRMSILCLASMVEILEDEFLVILPKTLEPTLSYLEETLSDSETDEDLVGACFSFAMAVLDHVPWILSGSYLDRLLINASRAEEEESAQNFNSLAAVKLSAQECFDALERTWQSIVEEGTEAVQLHISTLRQAVKHHNKVTMTKNAQSLFAILHKAFDLRRELYEEQDQDALNVLFDLVNNTAMDAVLKLNDATFRPFFIRLSDWALSSSTKGSDKISRATSLYSFAQVFFEQLKSLVTSYMGYLLPSSSELLTNLSPTVVAEQQLLVLVVQNLSTSSTHDQDGFWQSPSHFESIAKPLLSLLARATSLAEQTVIPAIAELAAAAQSPEHHKAINTMLMSLMRHHEWQVRLAAVKTQRALVDKLDIDWCGFLPEWVPVIAELQEDDEGIVERECLRWMEEIHQVTGESVEDMLR